MITNSDNKLIKEKHSLLREMDKIKDKEELSRLEERLISIQNQINAEITHSIGGKPKEEIQVKLGDFNGN